MQLDQVVRIPLLPVLAAQGLAVRRRAQQLPEPPGPRNGRSGSGPDLRLLIAGDSSAAGVGASSQTEALSGHLVRLLSKQAQVEWQLVACIGDTTKDVVQKLNAGRAQPFDVAVIALGVNDVTRATTAARFAKRQSELFALLQAKFGVRKIIASGVPPMGHFPLLPQPLRWVLGQHAARLDGALACLTDELPHVVHVPMNLPHDPGLAASDGFHPSPRAYELWAELLVRHVSLTG